MNSEMRCQDVRSRLSGYHDSALPPPLAGSIRLHLDKCPDCAGELAAISRVAGLVSGSMLDARPGFEERFARKLTARRAAGESWAARARLAKRLSAYAAAFLLAALVGLGPAVVRDVRDYVAPSSDAQILYLALIENGSGDQEDSH
ncbi:MAG: zf-HC2 domain-containing protein [Deltaproteobacteria bacterium]|nr:zf-HC2 domain-containing protein [Deltaproteobacteria bacterium]